MELLVFILFRVIVLYVHLCGHNKTKEQKMTKLQDKLILFDIDEDAVEWCGNRSPLEFWSECPHSKWMLQIIGAAEKRYTPEMRICVCEIVKTLPLSQELIYTIETAERYARGSATESELESASANVEESIKTIYWQPEWLAAQGVLSAVDLKWTIGCYAAELAEEWESQWTSDKNITDIVRKHFPKPPNILSTFNHR
jgi:hypothetical protein